MAHMVRVVLLLGCLAMFGSVAAAAPERRIAVLDVEGDHDDGIRDAITDVLADTYRVLPGRDYGKKAKQLDAASLEPADIVRVAAKLKLAAVVSSQLRKRNGRYELTLRVHEGRSGRVAKTLSVDLKKRGVSPKVAAKLAKRLVVAIDAIAESATRTADPGETSGASKPTSKADASEEELKAALRGRDDEGEKTASTQSAREDDEEPDGVSAGADAEDERPRRSSADDGDSEAAALAGGAGGKLSGKLDWRYGYLAIGGSFLARRVTYNSRAFAEAPLRHDGVTAAGLAARLEVAPFGFAAGPLRRLSAGIEVDHAIGFKTAVNDFLLPTTQGRYFAVLRYNQPLGSTPTSPSLRLEVAGGRVTSTLDTSALPAGMSVDVPDVRYLLIAPGLGVRVPLGTRAAVEAGARGLIALDAGPISGLDQYGGGTVTGIDGEILLEVLITRSISLRTSFVYTAIGLDFEGAGDLANARDGDPSTVDVGGALDRYAGGRVAIGALF